MTNNGKTQRADYLQSLREQVYDMYGLKKAGHKHGVCPCPGCGTDLTMFGTISHIDSNGKQHREIIGGWAFPRYKPVGGKVLKEALAAHDPARFSVECFNCTGGAIENGGICPHKESKGGKA